MSEKQYRDKIASIKDAQAKAEGDLRSARTAASKYRAEAVRHRAKTKSNTTDVTAKANERAAASADSKAEREDGKIHAATKRLAKLAKDLATAETNLENALKTSARRREQGDKQRQQSEIRHAKEVARASRRMIVRHVPVVAPKPEVLRVLYLTSNPHPFDPELTLRVDVEVRQVQQAVRAALHRDHIEIAHRPAATPEDLLDGLNDVRPHVVHFSGHAGDSALAFDNASVDDPDSRDLTYTLLARALAATDMPPALLVLNGCDTLHGAEVLLPVSPVVIAMASTITDLAAANFAARFYGAIAAAQPIEAALDQAAVALDMLGLDEGWKPRVLARDDVDLRSLVLVEVPEP